MKTSLREHKTDKDSDSLDTRAGSPNTTARQVTAYDAWKEVSRLSAKLVINTKRRKRLIAEITAATLRARALDEKEQWE